MEDAADPRRTGQLLRPYALAGPETPSRAQAKERADEHSVGGMRWSHLSVRKVARAEVVGEGIRRLLLKVVAAHQDTVAVATKLLRGESVTGMPAGAIEHARVHLRRGLHARSLYSKLGPLQPDIIAAYTHATGDPDMVLSDWLTSGAPLGLSLIHI